MVPISKSNMNSKTRKLKVGDLVEVRSREEISPERSTSGDGSMACHSCRRCSPSAASSSRFTSERTKPATRCSRFAGGSSIKRSISIRGVVMDPHTADARLVALFFWKNEWLKPVNGKSADNTPSDRVPPPSTISGLKEADVFARAQTTDPHTGGLLYSCQATQLPYATTDLACWDMRQYIEDYTSGNVSLWQIICGGVYSLYYALSRTGIGLGPAMQWFYDKFHRLWGVAREFPPGKRELFRTGSPHRQAHSIFNRANSCASSRTKKF